MKTIARVSVALCLCVLGAMSTKADSAFTGNITIIAANQLFPQSAVIFQLDKGNTDCAAGQWIYYRSQGDDLKAMYATVLAAKLAGHPIYVHFQTNNCVTDSIVVY